MLNFESLEISIKSDFKLDFRLWFKKMGVLFVVLKIHAILSNVLIKPGSHYKHEKLDTRK